MHLSELQSKQIVNIKDGKNIGKIVDAVIDSNGNTISFTPSYCSTISKKEVI